LTAQAPVSVCLLGLGLEDRVPDARRIRRVAEMAGSPSVSGSISVDFRGATDDKEPFTDPWKRFKTIEEAEQVARAARAAKDPIKVAYGRKNAARKNISQRHKVYLKAENFRGHYCTH